jgi:STAM-binding protein
MSQYHDQTSQGYHPSHDSLHLCISDPKLLTVSFPRDCLIRFISIASINTARNRETCGLLLGNYMGGRYAVTTLLIPKQHATSDICAMDEEELVTQFTEERSLITLGWVCCHLC